MLKILAQINVILHTPRQEKCLGIGAKQNSKMDVPSLLEREQSDCNLSLDYKPIRTARKILERNNTKE
jgi:hypothetical protein